MQPWFRTADPIGDTNENVSILASLIVDVFDPSQSVSEVNIDGVEPPVPIVSHGKICAEVGAPAFLAPQSGASHEPGHGNEVEEPPGCAIGRRLLHLMLLREVRPIQPRDGILEIYTCSEQARRPPHQFSHGRCGHPTILSKPAGSRRRSGLLTIRLQPSRRRRPLHGYCSTSSKHEAFEQRITGETVGAVDAGAGNLSGCKQSRQRSPAPFVGFDTTHHVVRRWANRNRIASEIETETTASFRNRRKPPMHVRGIQMCQREEHGAASSFDFTGDVTCDDVPRRQVARGMMPDHERITTLVDQSRALTTQRLGYQESRSVGQVERRGVELHELQVGDACAGMKSERNTVASRHGRVGRFAKDLPGAARRKQSRVRPDLVRLSALVEIPRSERDAALDDQLGHERMIDGRQRWQSANALMQDAPDLPAGGISCMEHSPDRVSSLSPQRGTPVRTAIELGSPLEKLVNVGDPVLDQHGDCRLVAQSITGAYRICGMKCRSVIFADRCCDPALGIACITFARFGFGKDRRPARARESNCGSQSGNTAADNEEVRYVGGQRVRMLS
jgi:hypothetical protein